MLCIVCIAELNMWMRIFNQISHHYITVMNDEIIVLGNFQLFGWMGANFVRYSRMNNFDWNCFFLDGYFSCRYGGISELLDTAYTTANIFIWFSFLLFQEGNFLKHILTDGLIQHVVLFVIIERYHWAHLNGVEYLKIC